MDRRRDPRHQVTVPVVVAQGPETPGPPGDLVDISRHGLLVRLSAPGRPPGMGDRVLLSLGLDDGMLHVLGRAVRSVRGGDGRWYVAAEFDEVEVLDRPRLDQLLQPVEQPSDQLVDAF
ncbi:MAG: PilZ domain-containing protein [Acidimicrobiales bacterium]